MQVKNVAMDEMGHEDKGIVLDQECEQYDFVNEIDGYEHGYGQAMDGLIRPITNQTETP